MSALTLSFSARVLLYHIAGHHVLTGKHLKINELPEKLDFTNDSFGNALIELSEKGCILGTPSNFRVNYAKFAAAEKANALKASNSQDDRPPAVMTLLRHFNERHSHFKRGKVRTSSRSLVQMRNLSRKYHGKLVFDLIDPFFMADSIRKKEGPLSTDDFYKWADYQLKQQTKRKLDK